ncbi:hypothetical protein [Halomonas sp. Y3]|uniref:hypothetical protein n=1 Tax=Halomonas sp. Y3 TaxID=2956797 RepID=UPI00209CE049|nr:hypothetical protein [Halomonas sp. Y3]
MSDSTNATQINVALAASGLAPMIAGATDNNADGAAGLNLDANGAELDTLAIDASGDASRFNFAVANNGAVIDTTISAPRPAARGAISSWRQTLMS